MMFGITTKLTADTKALEAATEKAAYESFAHAAASIRKEAIASVEKSKEPSPVGTPVHTRRGLARRAIQFHATKKEANIGFLYSRIGPAMAVHEKGGRRGKTTYQPRPTMVPAMEENLDRFVKDWQGSIG
jgi:hypothetical protein